LNPWRQRIWVAAEAGIIYAVVIGDLIRVPLR
jgi:hypothetical protein